MRTAWAFPPVSFNASVPGFALVYRQSVRESDTPNPDTYLARSVHAGVRQTRFFPVFFSGYSRYYFLKNAIKVYV